MPEAASIAHADRPASGAGTILSVQVMRGVAALAVVLYHTHLIFSRPEAGSIDVMGPLAANGWLGVNFFFVLSGFIILYAHDRDIGQPAKLPRYMWRRFTRLYPVYWVFLAAYLAGAAAGLGNAEVDWSAGHLLSAFTLTSLVESPVLPLKVAWTLLFEVMFYAVFAVMILSRRAGVVLIAAWAIAIVVKNVLYPAVHFDLLHVWNLYFLAGMGACLCDGRLDQRFGWPLLIAGLVAVVGLGALLQGGITAADVDPLLLGLLIIPFPLILVGGILLERRYVWKPPRLLLLLGDASYAIYLVHSAVLSLLAQLHMKFMPGLLPPVAVFAAAFLMAVVAGTVAHLVVEKPLLGALRRLGEVTPKFVFFGKRAPRSG